MKNNQNKQNNANKKQAKNSPAFCFIFMYLIKKLSLKSFP